jgi:uncharacterized SAM-binding protein YcdF (DUF218 family)
MIDFIKFIVNCLIQPWYVFWALLLIHFYVILVKKKQTQRWLYMALGWILITGTKFLPDLLVYGLESQYSVIDIQKLDNSKTHYIHVLGGGSYHDIHLPPHEQLSHPSLTRVNEGVRLYHAIPGSTMIFSGYSSSGGVTQAKIGANAAQSLGVDSVDILLLESSKTTEEEARDLVNLALPLETQIILVTSDIHMPRAMHLFKKAGLNPIPAPGGHLLKKHYKGNKADWWWSSGQDNFGKFSAAMHEYIGLVWAYL